MLFALFWYRVPIIEITFLKNCIRGPLRRMQFSDLVAYTKIARMPAITANSATPSTKAAVRIMLARISPIASG